MCIPPTPSPAPSLRPPTPPPPPPPPSLRPASLLLPLPLLLLLQLQLQLLLLLLPPTAPLIYFQLCSHSLVKLLLLVLYITPFTTVHFPRRPDVSMEILIFEVLKNLSIGGTNSKDEHLRQSKKQQTFYAYFKGFLN
uniref:Uncharacterized protein n=1 Tax=Glossina austeni TaxID=7395 RepID=A0A1A9V071_GLOAU